MILNIGFLVVYLSYKCNKNCRFCYIPKNINKIMNKETAKKVLEFIDENKIDKVQLLGSEPTLNKELLEFFVKELNKRNIKVEINTNGYYLDNLPKGEYELYIHLQPEWKDLPDLSKVNREYTILSVVDHENINMFDEFLEKFKDRIIGLAFASSNNKYVNKLSLKKFLDWFKEKKKKHPNLVVNAPFAFKYFNAMKPYYLKDYVSIIDIYNKLEISPDGKIYLDALLLENEKYCIGDLDNYNFNKILEYNLDHSLNCSFCKYKNCCFGHFGYCENLNKKIDPRCFDLLADEIINDDIYLWLIREHLDVMPSFVEYIKKYLFEEDLEKILEEIEKDIDTIRFLIKEIKKENNINIKEYFSLFIVMWYWFVNGMCTNGKVAKKILELLEKEAKEKNMSLIEYLKEIEGKGSAVSILSGKFKEEIKHELYGKFKRIQRNLYLIRFDPVLKDDDLGWRNYVCQLRNSKGHQQVLEKLLQERLYMMKQKKI